jgi:exonuclease III
MSINANGLRTMGKLNRIVQMKNSDILCIQETHWDNVCVLEVKKIWRDFIYVNNGRGNSSGVAILLRKDVVENVKKIYNDNNGRILILDFEYMNRVFRIINIYAPNNEIERRNLFLELGKWCKGNCILVGDFNVKMNRLDMSRGAIFRSDVSRGVLRKIMCENSLIDIWRDENPNKRGFSRRQVVLGELKQTRIDLVLVNEGLRNFMKDINYIFTTFSDHAGLTFSVGLDKERKGGGIWCMNAGYLGDEEYGIQLKSLIEHEMEDKQKGNDKCQWWENVKKKIKGFSIRYARKKRSRMTREEHLLREKLNEEMRKCDINPIYNIERFLDLKAQLSKCEIDKCKGASIRSRAKYVLEGEKCTSFFLGLEKTKQTKSYISEIENVKGEVVNDYVEILETVQNFYKDLFKKGEVDEGCVKEILGSVDVQIGVEDKQRCDRKITVDEVKDAIKGLQINKSPGVDGLIAEFYKMYESFLAPILMEVYQYMEDNNTVSDSMVTGLISILYKNKGSKLKLENYRPISLLNSDYKILAKILANRMKMVLNDIIAPTQNYSVPGRDIADTIITLRDVINKMNSDKRGGIVLSIDFNKAFDRVEHDFMFRVLEKYGFGNRIIGWIKLLYRKAKSRVKCNGVLTDSFILERSVRQGCPLSALLYVLSVEPLAAYLKKDNFINCVETPQGGFSLIHQYADDTTVIVRDEGSVIRVMECFKVYEQASGAKVNMEKSVIMYVGKINEGTFPFKMVNDYFKVLGVFLGVKEQEARDLTWSGVINKVRKVVNMWRGRSLKLKGKVIVVNSLLMSIFIHVMNVLDVPEWVLSEINTILVDFLWDGKGAKISFKTLIAGYEEGGLKLVDLNVRKKAIRVKMVRKYLYGELDYGWKRFFKEYLQEVGRMGDNGLLMCMKKEMLSNIPLFYREVFEAWGEFLPNIYYECTILDNILNQPIFLNPKIQYNNKMLYCKYFMRAGMRQIGDILYEVIPGFLPCQAIFDNVDEENDEIGRTTVENMYKRILGCLPGEWCVLINKEVATRAKGLPVLYYESNGKKYDLSGLKVKKVYEKCILREIKTPASEKVWSRVFVNIDVKSIWKNVNVKYNSIECEDNDFKLKHNRIFTNVVLHQINRDVKRECDICGTGVENFMHFFVECSRLEEFHKFLKGILVQHWGEEIVAGVEWRRLFLFGLTGKSKVFNFHLMNFVLSHARYAIRLRRNLGHYEGKIVSVEVLFRSILEKDIEVIYKYGGCNFEKLFVWGSTFIEIESNGKLGFNY